MPASRGNRRVVHVPRVHTSCLPGSAPNPQRASSMPRLPKMCVLEHSTRPRECSATESESGSSSLLSFLLPLPLLPFPSTYHTYIPQRLHLDALRHLLAFRLRPSYRHLLSISSSGNHFHFSPVDWTASPPTAHAPTRPPSISQKLHLPTTSRHVQHQHLYHALRRPRRARLPPLFRARQPQPGAAAASPHGRHRLQPP